MMLALSNSKCIPKQNSKQISSNQLITQQAARQISLERQVSSLRSAIEKAVNRGSKKARKKNVERVTSAAGVMRQAAVAGGLSHCAMKYAIAVADPWNKEAQGACVPRHPSRPSQKITIFNRFQMTIGGAGSGTNSTVGIIAIAPSLANDAPAIFYSTNAMGLTSLPSSAAQAQRIIPFLQGVFPNSPYSSSQFTTTSGAGAGPSVQGRVVSAGVSIQYMGSELYRGGTYSMYVSPNHDNMLNYAGTALNSYDETLIERIGEGKQWLVTSGLDETELVYNLSTTMMTDGTSLTTPLVYPYSNGQTLGDPALPLLSWNATTVAISAATTSLVVSGLNGTPSATGSLYICVPSATGVPTTTTIVYTAFNAATLTFTVPSISSLAAGLAVSGGYSFGSGSSSSIGCVPGGAPMIIYVQPANASSTNANVFEVEYVQHVEFIGPITSALHTPTHSDSVGFERVSTAVQRLPAARVESPSTSLLTLMGRELRQVAMEAAPTLVRMGASAIAGGAGRLLVDAMGTSGQRRMIAG